MRRAADRWYANNISNSTYGNNYVTGFTHQSEWLSGFMKFVGAGYGFINNLLMLPLGGAGYAGDDWAVGYAAREGMTGLQLVTRAAPKAEAAIGGSGDIVGTLKFTLAKNLLSRYQSSFGGNLSLGSNYFNGPAGSGF